MPHIFLKSSFGGAKRKGLVFRKGGGGGGSSHRWYLGIDLGSCSNGWEFGDWGEKKDLERVVNEGG